MLLRRRRLVVAFWPVVLAVRKLEFGDVALASCTCVVNVGAHAARARATERSCSCGLMRAIWIPRLLSSARRTASSIVSCRVWAPGVVAIDCTEGRVVCAIAAGAEII